MRDLEFYDFYAIVVEGLAYPFRKEDSSMLVECQILQTLSHLLGMARGRIGGSESLKYFDYN